MAELVYERSFKGAASAGLTGASEGCDVTPARDVTVARSGRAGQAAVPGLIDRIRALSLELLDVRLVVGCDSADEVWASER
jgi:hypothetical protein